VGDLPIWLAFGWGVAAGLALGVAGCLVVVLLEDAHRWGDDRRGRKP
jgi:hypothetical protein